MICWRGECEIRKGWSREMRGMGGLWVSVLRRRSVLGARRLLVGVCFATRAGERVYT